MENELKNVEKNGMYYFNILWNNKWFIILFTLIVTTSVGIYSFKNLKNQYKATVNLVPAANAPSDLAGGGSVITSALKDFGLSKMSGSSGESYAYTVILDSRTIKDTIIKKYNLAKEYNIHDTAMTKIRMAFDENKDISYEKDGNYFISIWHSNNKIAAEIANEFANLSNDLAQKLFKEEASLNLKYMEERVALIDSNLALVSAKLERFSKSKMIFSPTDQAKAVSTSLAELKAQKLLAEMNSDISKSNYGANDPNTVKYKNLATELDKTVKKAENEPGFAGNFAVNSASEVTLQYYRLYTEFETYSKVKAVLLPTVEKYRLDLTRSQKNLFVVDKAIVSEQKDRPKRSIIVLGAFIGSIVFSILIVLTIFTIRQFFANFKKYRQSL